MASDFVHLHLHTHYSMLDGACTASGPHLPGTQPLGVYRTVSFTGPLWRSLGPDMREEPPVHPKRACVQKESLIYLRHRERG